MMRRDRRGAALAVALFALVTMAAIADAVLAPSLASRRAAWRLAAFHAVESEAERALGSIAGELSPADWQALPVGPEVVEQHKVTVPGIAAPWVTVETRARRLGTTTFWVAATTSAPLRDAAVASRRSLLLELLRDSIRIPAAVTAGGDIDLAAGTSVAVVDDCATVDEESPSTLLAAPDAAVTRGGASTEEGRRDTTARAAATYLVPAGIRLAALLAAAAVRLPDGAVVTPRAFAAGEACVPASDNWGGSPPEACALHAPVIVADGDLLVNGGAGQGTLIVHGRLVIEGPFEYRGLIVATGGIETSGGQVSIDGAVLTSPGGDVRLHERAIVTASACSLSAAADATARIAVVPVRGWWR